MNELKPPPFDPDTEAFLADLRERSQGLPPPPTIRETREGTPAPPASMPASQAIQIGDDAKRAALATLEPKEKLHAEESKTGVEVDDPAEGESASSAGEDPGAESAPSGESDEEDNDQAPRVAQSSPNYSKPFKAGKQVNSKRLGLKRFENYAIEPERVAALPLDHPAIVEGRTLFPSTVVSARDTPRLLVSGINSRKLGKVVEKGPWKGMPIFQLTLEERATCPRSCLQWRTCFGSGMHMARRHDHRDPDFLTFLMAELVLTARVHPKGFVVRLHTLGDFYSVEYVRFWARAIEAIEEMGCTIKLFGYTAYRPDAEDPSEREIGQAIKTLTDAAWDAFAIRFSGTNGPQGTIVVKSHEEAGDAIVCPAETGATAACATCGLCWSETAKDKTIAFMLHGRKLQPGAVQRREGEAEVIVLRDTSPPLSHRRLRGDTKRTRDLEWKRRYDAGEGLNDIADDVGVNPQTVHAGLLAVGTVMRSRTDGKKVAEKRRETLRLQRIANAEAITASKSAPPQTGNADQSGGALGAPPPGEERAADVVARVKSSMSIVSGGKR